MWLWLHSEVLLGEANDTITIPLPSGDNNNVIIVVLLLEKFKESIILDKGYGENRKKFRMSNVDIESDIVDVLSGLYTFSVTYEGPSCNFRVPS